jgi:hypothetical protein
VSASSLADLAEHGFSAVSTAGLPTLARACREECIRTGDARFCLVGEALHAISEWQRENDKGGGTPAALIDRLDQTIRARLPNVLAADAPSCGAELADDFAREVRSFLIGPTEWAKRGYARDA